MKIDQAELAIMLSEHSEWLRTDGASGSQLNLEGAILDQRDLSGADLRYSILKGSSLIRSSLNMTNMSFADLREARLDYAKCEKSNFSNALMSDVVMEGAFLSSSNFSGASMYRASLRYADIKFAKFVAAKLTAANLGGANFTKSNFENCVFFGNEIESAIFAGANIDDAWLQVAEKDAEFNEKKLVQRANGQLLRLVVSLFARYFLLPLGFVFIIGGIASGFLSFIGPVYLGREIVFPASRAEFEFLWPGIALVFAALGLLMTIPLIKKPDSET